MAVFRIATPDGKVVRVEADDHERALSGAQEWYSEQQNQPSLAETGVDIGKSVVSKLGKAATGIAGFPGDIQGLSLAGIDAATGKPSSPASEAAPVVPRLPGSADIQGAVEQWTGPFYEPKTTPGATFGALAEQAPNAIIPGGPARRLLGVAAPALGGMVGEHYAGPYGKVAGALVGGAAAVPAANVYVARALAGQTGQKISNVTGKPVGAGAVRRLADNVAADEITPQIASARAAELGPDAMVMDLGRQMKGRAEAIASQPGKGQNTVLDAVEDRTGRFGEGTAARVKSTLDSEMGPTHNVVDLQNKVEDVVDRVAKPLYQKVMGDHPVVSVPGDITSRPAVASAMKNATTLAKQYGENISGTKETKTILSGPGFHIADDVTNPAQTSLQYWDYVKKDMDRRINAYMKSGGTSELNSADKADLGGLIDARRVLVNNLDATTKGAYKEARQASATKFELGEALDFGRSAFNSKLLPEEFISELRDMSAPAQEMAKAGFRRELDRIVQATRNEGATARRVLDTNQVLQKTEALFGPQAAREIERRISAENTFQEATQDIARNSRTAVRQALGKDTATPDTAALTSVSIPGLMLGGARGGINYIRQHGMDVTRSQIGDVLTAQGGQIDPVVRALMEFNQKKPTSILGVAPRSAVLSGLLARPQEPYQGSGR